VSVATPAQPPDDAANISWQVGALYGALLAAFLVAAAYWARWALPDGLLGRLGGRWLAPVAAATPESIPPFALSKLVETADNAAEKSRFARIRGERGDRPVLLLGQAGPGAIEWMNATLTFPDPDPRATPKHSSQSAEVVPPSTAGTVSFTEFSVEADTGDGVGDLFVLSLSGAHRPIVDVSVSGRRTVLLYDDADLVPRA
jgi:hypothetical protein